MRVILHRLHIHRVRDDCGIRNGHPRSRAAGFICDVGTSIRMLFAINDAWRKQFESIVYRGNPYPADAACTERRHCVRRPGMLAGLRAVGERGNSIVSIASVESGTESRKRAHCNLYFNCGHVEASFKSITDCASISEAIRSERNNDSLSMPDNVNSPMIPVKDESFDFSDTESQTMRFFHTL